jgi:hypothetical protein
VRTFNLIHLEETRNDVRKQINGALPMAYPGNINRASDYTCVIFIYFFSFGYSIGFGPNSWVYGTEVRLQLQSASPAFSMLALMIYHPDFPYLYSS